MVGIWPKIEPFRDFMPVLATFKFVIDMIKKKKKKKKKAVPVAEWLSTLIFKVL